MLHAMGGNDADRRSATRAQIIDAAFALFAKSGFAGTTTREIAERAEVNEVTVFRHFRSKEALFEAVIEEYSPVSMLNGELAVRLEGDDVGESLRQLAERYLAAAMPRAKVIHLGLMEAERNPELMRIVGQIPRRLRQHLADHLEDLAAEGRIRRRDYLLVAELFYGMLFQHVLASDGPQDLQPCLEVSDEKFAATLAELVACYLRPDPTPSEKGGAQ